jgi:hypothetical protein
LKKLPFRLFVAGLLAVFSGLVQIVPVSTSSVASRFWIDQVKQNGPLH